jgi:hypothetical protein
MASATSSFNAGVHPSTGLPAPQSIIGEKVVDPAASLLEQQEPGEQFGVQMNTEDITGMRTIGAVRRLLRAKGILDVQVARAGA